MRLAIMQPYFFPYIGYFQLVNAVDKFIFYDDVNYIKGGWINRNRILLNGEVKYFTLVLSGASPFKRINEIEVDQSPVWKRKLLTSIELSYKKAPYFNTVFPLIKKVIDLPSNMLVDYARASVLSVVSYLETKTEMELNSSRYASTGLKSQERIIYMCKKEGTGHYINPIGGMEMYSKEIFLKEGIKIEFIKTGDVKYNQQNKEFVPNLSIVDVLMYNSTAVIKEFLNQYTLI
jgi:hypothetical protein